VAADRLPSPYHFVAAKPNQVLPQDLTELLVEAGIAATSLAAFPDSAAFELTLRANLESSKYPDAAQRRVALGALLVTLQYLGRYDDLAAALHADWSPVSAECSREFDTLYVAALKATGTSAVPLRRRPRLQELAAQLALTRGVAGDVAECGCFRGLSSHLMCQTLRAERRAFDGGGYHVFDSFQGLSEPMPEDAIPEDDPDAASLRANTGAGQFRAPLELVQSNLREFPRITFHPGWIPYSFYGLAERRYRFVHVDVDLYDPTADALNYFYDRILPGGAILSDDYGWPGARLAFSEFAAARGLPIEVTPHNQAILRRA